MSKFEQEFEVMREIGRGGFGVVYECRNKVLDKEYAVKVVILPQNPKMSAIVFREVRTLVRLEHPN
jgi:serine/threonine protein kinase